jgi:hypothetical protein
MLRFRRSACASVIPGTIWSDKLERSERPWAAGLKKRHLAEVSERAHGDDQADVHIGRA